MEKLLARIIENCGVPELLGQVIEVQFDHIDDDGYYYIGITPTGQTINLRADWIDFNVDLLPCPFCGHWVTTEGEDGDITCPSCAYTFYDTSVDHTWWNTRAENTQMSPSINAWREENQRLMRIIEHIHAISSESYRDGSEYFDFDHLLQLIHKQSRF